MGTGAVGALESTHWPNSDTLLLVFGQNFVFVQIVFGKKDTTMLHLFLLLLPISLAQGQGVHFFGPPAVGFGVGLVSVHRKFPVGTSIVSRRSSRSYSHQSFYQATPRGTVGYSTRQYSVSDHFYTARHLRYYQPNVYHYHSTPWRYRWGRATNEEARTKREARLVEIGDIKNIPVGKISDVAANVSIGYQPEVWENDMIFKDQDDCSKRLLCELNAMRKEGKELSEDAKVLVDAYGKGNNLDIGAETLEFDIAAVLGRTVGKLRCELSYRRCETSVEDLLDMIRIEVDEIENIQKEVENNAIDLKSVEERLEEEDAEVASLTVSDLTQLTTTPPPDTDCPEWWSLCGNEPRG